MKFSRVVQKSSHNLKPHTNGNGASGRGGAKIRKRWSQESEAKLDYAQQVALLLFSGPPLFCLGVCGEDCSLVAALFFGAVLMPLLLSGWPAILTEYSLPLEFLPILFFLTPSYAPANGLWYVSCSRQWHAHAVRAFDIPKEFYLVSYWSLAITQK